MCCMKLVNSNGPVSERHGLHAGTFTTTPDYPGLW